MNEELFNEATKSNVLTKKLIDQLLESMTYSSISFINWTIETLSLIKARLQRGDRITDEVSGEVYTLYSFQQFVEKNFSTYIASQVFKETSKPEKIYFSLKPCEEGYSLVAADSDSNKTYSWTVSYTHLFILIYHPGRSSHMCYRVFSGKSIGIISDPVQNKLLIRLFLFIERGIICLLYTSRPEKN